MKRFPLSMKVMMIAMTVTLGGCTVYQPMPLNLQATLPEEIPHLTVDPASFPLPHSVAFRFDSRDGLDSTEVAILAVVNNPELKLARDDAGTARAQAFAAGLLPDPQIGAGVDFPTGAPAGSDYNAYNLGLNYDFTALVTRGVANAAAEQAIHQADLNLLWQEWQVASQARLLFARRLQQDRLLKVLSDYRDLLSDRSQRMHQAVLDGNATLDAAAVDLAALQDVERQNHDLQRSINQTHHELTWLLGISPKIRLPLVGDTELPPLDEERVNTALSHLSKRRPDLLALQAGYQSQDQRYRKAILEQFPSLTVGVTRASDTSNVKTLGVGVTLSLPLFNRNRGNIALEEASRQRLHDEFETRLLEARGAILQILADQHLLEAQRSGVSAAIAQLEQSTEAADQAFQAGNIDEMSYLALQTSLINKNIERINLEQASLDQRIGLQALLGGEIPIQSMGREGTKP